MYWGSCLQSVTVLRAAKAAEISNQMPCVPPLEEALLSARVEVTCTSVLTLNAVLATSLTMTRYFGELSNAERTTPPPKRRHTAKKEEKKKRRRRASSGEPNAVPRLRYGRRGGRSVVDATRCRGRECLCWHSRSPPGAMVTRHSVSSISSNNKPIWKKLFR